MDPALDSRQTHRSALPVTALAPLIPQLLGSAFNIWYNSLIIQPLLTTEALRGRFIVTIAVFNAVVFPLGIALWLRVVMSLKPVFQALCAGEEVAAPALLSARLLRCFRVNCHR